MQEVHKMEFFPTQALKEIVCGGGEGTRCGWVGKERLEANCASAKTRDKVEDRGKRYTCKNCPVHGDKEVPRFSGTLPSLSIWTQV